MTKVEDAARVEPNCYPLIAYVHVPKTAGSTIEKVLDLCTPRGHSNIENVISDQASFLDLARNSDWIAGHVPRDSLATGLIWHDRPIEYFASVREPVAQLVSHLNWSFEKYSRSNYYDFLNRDEQCIDAEVMSVDFSNSAAVMSLLLRHASRYLNAQSRYILGADFAGITDSEIMRRLASYTYVASEYDLPKLYRAFGFAQLPEGVSEIRENVTKRCYVRTDIFDSPELRAFLAYHHRHDPRLYAAVRAFSWSTDGRHAHRPAMLPKEVFTSENFDEQSYLNSHPGVATAVMQGHFESGRAHFEAFGYKENRMMRRWVWPPAVVSKRRSTGADISPSSALDRIRRVREDRARISAELQLLQGGPAGRTTG
jgi:hypothetical protein